MIMHDNARLIANGYAKFVARCLYTGSLFVTRFDIPGREPGTQVVFVGVFL